MSNKRIPSQSGAAILILLMIIFIAGSTVVLSINSNDRSPFLQQELQMRDQAFRAKEALLAYAMQYADLFADEDASDDDEGPGRLPCPDLNNTGAPGNCSSLIGRLPILDLPGGNPFPFNNEFVGIDRQFWYAVSANFNSTSALLNSNTAATLTLDGIPGYVAVLIAPGDIIATQVRPSNTDPAAYLEAGNESGGTTYVNSYAVDPESFTDQVLGITKNELMTLTTVRTAGYIKDVLHRYHLGTSSNINLDPIIQNLIQPNIQAVLTPLLGAYPAWLQASLASIWETAALNTILTTLGISSDPDSYPLDTFPASVTVNLVLVGNVNIPIPALSGETGFSILMEEEGPEWYLDDGWDTVTDPNYTLVTADQATFSFTGCSIVFTVDYNEMGTPADDSDDTSDLSKAPISC